MLFYNPLDWYWIVGGGGPHLDENGEFTGDETRRYASGRNQYVPVDDATFVAWRDAAVAMVGYDPTTRIDTETNLAAVLEPYGITPNFGA
jgi:hypothetical protein